MPILSKPSKSIQVGLANYAEFILDPIRLERNNLEEEIISRGRRATKEEKAKLEKLSELYDEGMDLYEKMLAEEFGEK